MVAVLLVPSPLLGPASWRPVEVALARLGHAAEIVTVEEVRARSGDVVLVPHSNAGYRAPWLAEQLGARAIVFVDAALPPPDAETCPLAPPEFLDFLRGLADPDGVLPPWTRWWPEEDVAGLFPDEETRAEVEAGQPRLPLRYFTQRVPVPSGWASRPCAYLGFGDTYAAEIAFAQEQGWPVTVLDGGHLHQLHEPETVAEKIVELARGLASAG